MANRRPRGRERFSPKIENLRWDGAVHVFSGLSAGTAGQVMVTAADTKDTIMRIRGEVVGWLDGAQAAGVAGVEIGIGCLVMPEGQSTTVVSSPIADVSAPWLFYERFTLAYDEMVIDVIDVPQVTSFRKTIDVKAMRILRPDRELQLVFEQATVIGAASVNCIFNFRMLLGQH